MRLDTFCIGFAVNQTPLELSQSYAYDGGTSGGPGNPTSFKGATNSFNADNQQTGTGFGYDGAGNPVTYRGQPLSFDPANRMTSDSMGSQTNAYDGDDLRVWKRSSSTTYFLYDGTMPVGEYASTGTTVTLAAVNTFGADGLVSRHTSAGSTFYAFDEHGNVSQRLSSTGAVVGSDLYDAYGTRVGSAAQSDPWGYNAQDGYYTDTETGLILCTHRFYDPANGRFVTRDPIGYGGGINLYEYVGNNSVNEDDPSGFIPIRRPVHGPPAGLFPPGGPYFPGVPQHPAGVNILDNIQLACEHKNDSMLQKEAWLFSLVFPHMAWDYKQEGAGFKEIQRHYGDGTVWENIYDAFGNFNFGAVAAALGINEQFALDQADTNHKDVHWGEAPKPYDHGDWWIKDGYNWYKQNQQHCKCQ